jgi:hypothetical protein
MQINDLLDEQTVITRNTPCSACAHGFNNALSFERTSDESKPDGTHMEIATRLKHVLRRLASLFTVISPKSRIILHASLIVFFESADE